MRILAAIALFIFWLVLSASANPIHVVTGAVFAALIMWLSPKAPATVRRFSWLALLAYTPWLVGRILKSGFHVSSLILRPSMPIAPELVNHKTHLSSDGELVVLGNSITLTPGTITVEVAPGELVVHAIDADSQKDLLSGALDKKVGSMFSPKEGVQ